MVTLTATPAWTLLAQSSPLLDPPTRAVLAMALLAFVILGIGLVVGVLLGGHWFRRWGGDNLRQPLPLRQAESKQPDALPAMLRGTHWDRSGDTAQPDPQTATQTRPADGTRLSDSTPSV